MATRRQAGRKSLLRSFVRGLALLGAFTCVLPASGQSFPFAGPQNGPTTAPTPEMIPAPAPSAARQLVVGVEILGNNATKEYEIQKHLHTRADREFDAELVQADVRRLVQTGLFRDVKTYTRPSSGGVVVIFEVFERSRINYLRHIGNRGITEKKLLKEHGLKEGNPLNAFSSEEARRKIEDLYHQSGFTNATVTLLEGDKKEDQGVVFLIDEGQLERISSVVFEGNTIASDSRLKTQIQSKPGILWYFIRGKVNREQIDADVEKLTAYYRSLGFFRARVGRELIFDDSGKWLTLKFVIDEGPRYVVRNVSVEGNTKFASQPLLDYLQLQSGEHFNQASMNRDLNTIVDLYGSQGHVFADVQADPRFLEEPGQLDIVYRIQEGDVFKVGDINVNIGGEFPHTKHTVVLNRSNLRPGDIIDSRELRNWERRLKASQLFEVDPQTGEPPRVVVRPPDMSSIGNIASSRGTTIRGQSPEASESPAWQQPVPPAESLHTGTTLYSWEGRTSP